MAVPKLGCALVTGAASGIGRAAAIALAKRGYAVVVTDVNESQGHETVEEIVVNVPSARASFFKLDVADETEWSAAVAFAVSEYGGLEVLVNNAGMSSDRVPIQNVSLEVYERVMKVTSTSVFLGCKTAAAELFKSGSKGSVVNVCSMMSQVGGTGNSPAYSAAKGAVRTITKNIAIAWAAQGVRVNSVHPGYIDTPLIRRAGGSERLDHLVSLTPLGRLGTAEEVAKVIVFLATDDSSFMTGSEVFVDGGYTCA